MSGYSISDIDELIEEYELEDIKDYINKKLKKGIRLVIGEEDNFNIVGASSVGGYPDVTENFIWPLTSDGELMTFIAQLNLKELSSSDEGNLLPNNGMLYFFMGLDEPAYDIEHKVIFVETAEKLKLLVPETTTVLDDVYDKFTAYKLIVNKCFDLPNYAYIDYDIVDDSDSYFDMQEELRNEGDNYIGFMFGYPSGQHDDSELEAALQIIANTQYGHSSKDKDKLVAFFNGDAQKAEDEINDIQMLLEITSNEEVGFQWWDCGDIHFFIRKEDLLNRRFDKTYLSLYSS